MKLPLSDSYSATNGSGNGYYGQNNHSVVVLPAPSPDPSQNEDFSEYFWMENEEEFDNQVMKELEEEALMEQCYLAMVDDSMQALIDSLPANGSSVQSGDSNAVSASEAPNGSELIMAMRGLQVNDIGSNGVGVQSQPQSEARLSQFKFNPMAKEFIPGGSCYRPGAQPSSRNPCFAELVDNQPDA